MSKTDPRDKKLEDKLDKLFPKWEKELKEKFDKELKKNFEKKLKERLDKELKGRVDKELEEKIAKELEEKIGKEFKFSKDGALPGYFKQKYKILSIGRESHSKTPNLNTLVEQFLSGGSAKGRDGGILREGKKNNLMCWRLAARIVYGLPRKKANLDAVPEKKELEKPFSNGEFSFAVMNVSKYANPEGPKRSKHFLKYVEASLGDNNSGRNFTREEIELLNPDLIFTWNIKSVIAKRRFNKLLTGNHKQDPEKIKNLPVGVLPGRAWVYKFDDGRGIPLLDTWHLSIDPRSKKDPQEGIYDPLVRAFSSDVVQKLIAEKKAQDKKKG